MSQSADPSNDPASERRIYTIAQLLGGLRRLLEDRVGRQWVVGEVSNLHRARSGHCYFSLKDEAGQVRAVLFRASAQRMRFELEEGLEVLVYADVTVYEARGDLQLIVREVEPRGQGPLQLAFEQLRARLEAEGIFDESRKRALPEYPRALAVVTSPTSAAVRDVIHVARRRMPGVPLYVVPTRVQGVGAEREIAAALDAVAELTGREPRRESDDAGDQGHDLEQPPGAEASQPALGFADDGDSHAPPRLPGFEAGGQVGAPVTPVAPTDLQRIDAVLLVRGGGSLEDLMCFNSERVARAILRCPLPVVSGVGHEVDVTIADLVADVRAATPSTAAATALPDRRALASQLRKDWGRLCASLASRLQQLSADWRREHEALRVLAPSARLAAQRIRLDALVRALAGAGRAIQADRRARFGESAARLDSLSPLAVLARGYALVRRERDGEIVRRGDQLRSGERLSIRVAQALIDARVESVEPLQGD